MLKDHNLTRDETWDHIIVERRPLRDADGNAVEGLVNHWIILNNPRQYNSYTTDMVKEVILAFRRASNDRSAVAVIFTGAGDRAFCTGGNTKEYAEYYAGHPEEYRQYMRLFNDMVTGIMLCDKPVINRVNGMRIGGGQEIGMACDFSIAADTALFGQAGPRHGSAPDGGSTDFLHLYVGVGRAMESCTLCEPWTAYQAVRYGLVNRIVPVLRNAEGEFVRNPLVVLDEVDAWGNPAFGTLKTGEEKARAREQMEQCTVDFELLDREVELWAWKLANTMPGCLIKTIESVRKKKLEHWQRNSETNGAWLALNMLTEARAGFRAFNEGPKHNREVDFMRLRRALGEGAAWTDELIESILPRRED